MEKEDLRAICELYSRVTLPDVKDKILDAYLSSNSHEELSVKIEKIYNEIKERIDEIDKQLKN